MTPPRPRPLGRYASSSNFTAISKLKARRICCRGRSGKALPVMSPLSRSPALHGHNRFLRPSAHRHQDHSHGYKAHQSRLPARLGSLAGIGRNLHHHHRRRQAFPTAEYTLPALRKTPGSRIRTIGPCPIPPGQTLTHRCRRYLWENKRLLRACHRRLYQLLESPQLQPGPGAAQASTPSSARPSWPTATGSAALPARWSPALSASVPSRSPKKSAADLGFARSIAEQENRTASGVAETCRVGTRHRLILMTKGNRAEQATSWLAPASPRIFQPSKSSRKGPATYREVIHRHELKPHTSWYDRQQPQERHQSRSGRSLHAVFLFQGNTWVLEHAEIAAAPERPATMSSIPLRISFYF